ncbi:MAG: flagellar biosynthesis anti-sigma factor FlgM [Sulfuricurvum sp.]|uniref:flagellar biosynthesis anti-sigma factor FlgM n=1 Tax=Sulfuricurvum sp. TaxID=2025608 RepID=UPI002624D2FE|nr:flagellar biosynthesis anti-sigma factor FlgM [Sulfuricurvum sp.]MDD2837498.1 flagellar biosynthesis anti-sigma factor FlgM [Sulfuricurvum sp.]MDD3596330.1 flagellar biosynthesis anti-sigma factor FlgM [Sulfuricurvum sp.]MDD4883495.1 flagellar biosynthesis anti-sigma factor FlgM [Sulfuricurvum sp.]
MISSVNSSLINGAYKEQSLKTKEQEKSTQSITKQGDTSRIEELKNSIEKGEYRVDIEALAKRIAQELT